MTALEYAADVKAEVVGKPEKAFFLGAVEEFNVKPHQCVMIGDVSAITQSDLRATLSATLKKVSHPLISR